MGDPMDGRSRQRGPRERSGAPLWDVSLPERSGGRGHAGYARPRATLRIQTDEFGDEAYTIPVAVGRSLLELKQGGAGPRYRTELLYELRERSRSCASARAEALVAKRDYSSSELSRKLMQDGYTEKVASELVARYVELGIVCDERYAAVFMRSKVSQGWGPRRIEQELSRRGIDAQSVPGWPEEFYGDESPEERAYRLAARRSLPSKNPYEKLVRFLCGKGYSIAVASSVARRVLDERSEGEVDEALY